MSPFEVRSIARDPLRFESFYREHVDAVQRFLARRVSDPQLVADLTAEVFLAAIVGAESYDPARGASRAWLYGIARHALASRLRRDARERSAMHRISARDLLDDDDIERLLERIGSESQTRALLRGLDRLPPSERSVLELVAVDELALAEAARLLGIRRATARVRLHRARRRMRSQLQLHGQSRKQPAPEVSPP